MKANPTLTQSVGGGLLLPTALARLRQKTGDYMVLVKTRLSGLVVFTTAAAYLLAAEGVVSGSHLLLVLLGSFLVIGAANAFNEVIERDSDALMSRTANRPLPAGRMSVTEALVAATLMAAAGLGLLLVAANPLTAALAALALAFYVLAYTPLKRHTPLCTLVGAVPGAIPPLMGWAAVRGDLSGGGWVLFLIQFLWQFPHFWSIAWLARDDYARAGFRMLPMQDSEGSRTARQIVLYSLTLIPVGLLPTLWGMGGILYSLGAVLMGSLLVVRGVRLWQRPGRDTGRQVMFAALLYLPVLLLLLLLGL